MKEIIRFSDIRVSVSRSDVLKLMECGEDNPIYEEVVEEYEELKDALYSLGKPQALFCFDRISEEWAMEKLPAGTPVIFSLLTEGGGISARSTGFFKEGDYLKGMLADAYAGAYLFALEKEAMELLKKECAARHLGIRERLEAPGDVPMEMQKRIYEACEAEKIGMGISSGYMFDPVKSSGQILVLTEDEQVFKAQHDCTKCTAVNCKMRKTPVSLTMIEKEKEETLLAEKGRTVFEVLKEHGKYFSAFCGGKGTCGKCRIQILGGSVPVTEQDRKFFRQEELAAGWRLACRTVLQEDLKIRFTLDQEESFEAVASFSGKKEAAGKEQEYGIAVDIGTTTLAACLCGMPSGRIVDSCTAVNRQRIVGADVISRIQASVEGHGPELRESIREDLCGCIRELLKKTGIPPSRIRKIAIAGNTTMGHLLMGYPCDTLGVVPFTPVNIKTITADSTRLLGEIADDKGERLQCPATLLPGISTYVGADIAAGIYSCGMASQEETSLLIDLGTNGEMAIGNKDRILVTSTAAGPAFEGGNISWGMGSVQGAVCSVQIEDGKASCRTIGDQPPLGLCGTGVVETAAELVRSGLVDETGLLDEEYEDGFCLGETPAGEKILFTQKDVREIQLAKSAVRAGLETLLLRYGTDAAGIHKVYLAGGFGFKLDLDKAVSIGLFPQELRGKIQTVGNSSLGGAVQYLTDKNAEEKLEEIIARSEEINLSADKEFNEFYMEYMFFEK